MAINFSGSDFLDSLTEIIGFKCGVALDRSGLRGLLKKIGADGYANCDEDQWIRIHSEEYEGIVYELLTVFGRLEPNFSRFPTIRMFHQYKENKKLRKIYEGVTSLWVDWLDDQLANLGPQEKVIDPTPFLLKVLDEYGRRGFEMADELIAGHNAALIASPWGNLRQVDWQNQIELKSLFESEGLNAEYGNFIDQRYIDFLHANFSDIDKMHWRKFEQLTAEFLDRSGYRVEIGPGRGDDGVDVRAWPKNVENGYPQIIVQCKRQKAKVDKPIIKSLYADVVHENATSGLLVTTSQLSPGAESVRSARSYPIAVADRNTLREWLSALRKPGVGSFQS
jgi:restriction system protein